MGIVLDSSLLIGAERRAQPIASLLRTLKQTGLTAPAIPVEPFTKEMAEQAARIDAESRKKGKVIPLADLQIGVTALELGYAVATHNPRHFHMIPGLTVLPF